MNNPIRSKSQFYNLWQQGLLGNKPRTWKTYAELKESGFIGTVALRYCGKGSGAPFIPNLTVERVPQELTKLSGTYSAGDYQISEQLSPDKIKYLINGEVVRTHQGLALFFSTQNKLMRESLLPPWGKQVYQMTAHAVLQKILPSLDYEALMDILERFPDHVVEFSSLSRCVGILPHRRMIIWEVRLY